MKHIYCFYWILTGLLLCGCASQSLSELPESQITSLTIEEAKVFFETQIQHNTTRSGHYPTGGPLSPGNFAPQWETAKTSQNNNIASVDIPIITQNHYRAIQSEFKGGAQAYSVSITQKLIVMKDRSTDVLSQYILTLIPDRKYYATHKGDISNKFLNSGDKGKFSGIALYTHPELGIPIRISKFQHGVKTEGIYLIGTKDQMRANIIKAERLMREIRICRVNSIPTTRIGMEDEDWKQNPTLAEWINQLLNGVPDGQDAHFDVSYDPENGGWWVNWYDSDGNHINNSYLPDPDPSNPGGGGWEPIVPEDPDKQDPWICMNCGSEFCNGDCQKPPYPESNPGTNPWPDPEDPEDPSENINKQYEQKGRDGISKISADLRSGKVSINKCVIGSQGASLINAAGLGINTNGIITSCISFMENADNYALSFGRGMSIAGIVVGSAQTYIGFTDGDISTGDILNAISTALGAAGYACAFIPGAQIVGGVLGVSSCVIGLISNFFSYNLPSEIHIRMQNGTNIHLYLTQNYLC